MIDDVSNVDNWIVHFPEEQVLAILEHVREMDSLALMAGIRQKVNISYPYHQDLSSVEVILENNTANSDVGELVSKLRLEKTLKELVAPYGGTITYASEEVV
jgi:hypothetical protein